MSANENPSPRPWSVSRDGDFFEDANGDPVCDLRYWHLPHNGANAKLVLELVNAGQEGVAWRPIKSARRDGRTVELREYDGAQGLGRMMAGRWYWQGGNGKAYPTHWRPLCDEHGDAGSRSTRSEVGNATADQQTTAKPLGGAK